MSTMTKRRKPAPKKTGKSAADNPWPEKLLALRGQLGLNQAQAAAKIQISQSQWSSYESGARQPTRPIAHLISLLENGTI
jgi:DNA-binding transcriptional regulator YiaG